MARFADRMDRGKDSRLSIHALVELSGGSEPNPDPYLHTGVGAAGKCESPAENTHGVRVIAEGHVSPTLDKFRSH